MTRSLPGTAAWLHTVAPTTFAILFGHSAGTNVAELASILSLSRAALLTLPPPVVSQYISLLAPMHSNPLSGQQCLLFYASVIVYLRGDVSWSVPHFVSAAAGVAAALQTLITSGSTSPFWPQKRPPFPATAPNVVAVQRSALVKSTFGQQDLNEVSWLFTFLKLAPKQTSSN